MNTDTIKHYTDSALKNEVLKLQHAALQKMLAREERINKVLMFIASGILSGGIVYGLMNAI